MKKGWLYIAASGLLLSGCAAVLVGGGAAGGYTAAQHQEGIGQYSSDAFITSKVKAKFLADINLKSYNISVATIHGVVALTGSVPSSKMRHQAILIVQQTEGVRAVNVTNFTVMK